ncbi:hypothetical protein BOTBODRAFT_357687 [Botryobasidium botryosum FD-172 SS1]|uniref:DUF7704 domain-containing protein n=1 Tax=Botryobasidium botryosum (strain FD-172 SS1) TaxID=930990 RepID=A0A067MEN6_BOTB1|nr:hypothetical protein BOTBODRAFT_357687 [Botryobasidium botryosum FD-172 SS1]
MASGPCRHTYHARCNHPPSARLIAVHLANDPIEMLKLPSFPALPGLYSLTFMYLEPIFAIGGAVNLFKFPGPIEWHHSLVPTSDPVPTSLDPGNTMSLYHLGCTYLLMGLAGNSVLRFARNRLGDGLVAQRRLVGAYMVPMIVSDVVLILATLLALPGRMALEPSSWNFLTHANIWMTVVLLAMRLSWVAGVGVAEASLKPSDN